MRNISNFCRNCMICESMFKHYEHLLFSVVWERHSSMQYAAICDLWEVKYIHFYRQRVGHVRRQSYVSALYIHAPLLCVTFISIFFNCRRPSRDPEILQKLAH